MAGFSPPSKLAWIIALLWLGLLLAGDAFPHLFTARSLTISAIVLVLSLAISWKLLR
jgi:hypothetical protein